MADPAAWRIVLCDRDGISISILDGIASDVTLGFRLNRAATCSFTVPSDDHRVNTVHSDGFPYLTVGVRTVKAWRKSLGAGEAGEWKLKFAGIVWITEEDGDTDSCRTYVQCFDHLKVLEKRIVRRWNGRFEKDVKWHSGGDSGQDKRDGSQGPSHIVKQMIERTNTYAGYVAGGPTEAGTVSLAPTGIVTDGDWEATTPVTVSYRQEYIMPAIITFCDMGLMDLVLTDTLGAPGYLDAGYDDNDDGIFIKLGAVEKLGTDLGNAVVISYAVSPYTGKAYTRTQTMEMLATRVSRWVEPIKGPGYAIFAGPLHGNQATTYGVFESISPRTDIKSRNISQALTGAELRLRKNPADFVTLLPEADTEFKPWDDWWLGDFIGAEAGSGASPATREAISGTQRVYGFTIALDEDFGEYVSDMTLTVNGETGGSGGEE